MVMVVLEVVELLLLLLLDGAAVGGVPWHAVAGPVVAEGVLFSVDDFDEAFADADVKVAVEDRVEGAVEEGDGLSTDDQGPRHLDGVVAVVEKRYDNGD